MSPKSARHSVGATVARNPELRLTGNKTSSGDHPIGSPTGADLSSTPTTTPSAHHTADTGPVMSDTIFFRKDNFRPTTGANATEREILIAERSRHLGTSK